MRVALALVLLLLVPAAAHAQGLPLPEGEQDEGCLRRGVLPQAQPRRPLRFGITPQLAGSAGAAQLESAPEDDARTLAALNRLRVPGRELVLRLNRMFWSDGDEGLRRYAALVDRYAAAGYATELQVRYHPPEGREGDIAGWTDYVRAAVRTFARRRSVVALSITNEGNLPLSPNTSDGVYEGVVDALVQGVVVARSEADRLGRPDLELGFTYAYRYSPQADNHFFDEIGAKGTPAFRAALDHVGLQVYPGLFWPPATTDAPADVLEAAALLRFCWMPRAGLGPATRIWVSETGYATRGGVGVQRQAADLAGTLATLHEHSGTLGISDVRYFNLRDNASRGPDLFDAVGVLFDDYRPKRAFDVLRAGIAGVGAAPEPAPPAAQAVARPRLRVSVSPRRIRRGRPTTLRARVTRVADGVAVRGARVRVGDRSVRTDRRGRARLRVRLVGRPGRRTLRVTLRGARGASARLAVLRGR